MQAELQENNTVISTGGGGAVHEILRRQEAFVSAVGTLGKPLFFRILNAVCCIYSFLLLVRPNYVKLLVDRF